MDEPQPNQQVDDLPDEVELLVYLGGGADDDPGSLAQAVAGISRQWSSIGTLRPPPAVEGPPGTRYVPVAEAGAVCAAVLPLLPDLLAALQAVRRWLTPGSGRTATVIRADGSSIELGGLSEADQRLLIDDFIAGRRRRR